MINHIGRKSHLSIHPLVRHIDPPQCPKHFPNLSQHHSEFFHVVDSVGGEGIEGEHGHGLCIYGIWHVEEVGGGGGRGALCLSCCCCRHSSLCTNLHQQQVFHNQAPTYEFSASLNRRSPHLEGCNHVFKILIRCHYVEPYQVLPERGFMLSQL